MRRTGALLRHAAVAAVLALATTAGAATPALAQPSPYLGRIVGHVTANGQPAANVQITVRFTSGQVSAWATTDADGWYATTEIPAYNDYKVEFATPDWRRQWAHQKTSFEEADVFTVVGGQDTVVDEALFPTGSLVLTAVDAVTGAPVNTFYGQAWGPSGGRNGYTQTGTLTLADLLPGEYSVSVYPSESHFHARGSAVVVAEQTTAVQVAVEPAASITTTVVDATTGQPVENACASAVSDLDMLGLNHGYCTGADGRLTIGWLRTNSYRIFVKPNDGVHGAQWVGADGGTGSRYLAAELDAQAGSTVTAPTVRLDGAGTVGGTVTDEAAGSPVARMCAYPYATGTDAGPEVGPHCSDAQGSYSISGLGPYWWPIEFVGEYSNRQYAWQWSGGRPNQLVARHVRVEVGSTATVDAALKPGATVRGRVLTTGGAPILGVVRAVNALTGDQAAAYAVVDDNGHYEIPSLAGQFVRLSFEAAYPDYRTFWYRDATAFGSATPVWVPAGGTVENIDFAIPAG